MYEVFRSEEVFDEDWTTDEHMCSSKRDRSKGGTEMQNARGSYMAPVSCHVLYSMANSNLANPHARFERVS